MIDSGTDYANPRVHRGHRVATTYSTNGLPVAANFDGNVKDGDQIGLFNGTQWFYDTHNQHVINGTATVVDESLLPRTSKLKAPGRR